MIKLYGIKNCGTVKKARQWLDIHHIPYNFHDYKTQGLSQAQLEIWVKKLGWQQLLNTRGTTWRQVPEHERNTINEQTAIALMLQKTSLIKRPLLEFNDQIKLGFNEADYQQWFNGYEGS